MKAVKLTALDVEIQPRDFELLNEVLNSRLTTLNHLSEIHFEGKREAAKKRVQKLKKAGFIRELPRNPFSPSLLTLSPKGIALLQERGLLSQYPTLSTSALAKRSRVGQQTISHELAVLDVKAAFFVAARSSGTFSIKEFGTWPRLYQFSSISLSGQKIMVKPDGFVRITDNGGTDYSFFLEVDRSTESQSVLTQKAYSYLEYFRSGGFAKRCGKPASDFKEHPFRVLIVVKSCGRLDNLARKLLISNPPILTFVWIATMEDVTRDPFGEIWYRPIEYRSETPTPQSLFGEK